MKHSLPCTMLLLAVALVVIGCREAKNRPAGDQAGGPPPAPAGAAPAPPAPLPPKPAPPPDQGPSPKAKEAIAALHDISVRVTTRPDGWKVDLSYAKDPDEAVRRLAHLDRVDEVESGDKTTDAHLAAIAQFKDLRALKVTFSKNVTDAGLESLKGLTRLKRLDLLYDENVTAAGLDILDSFPDLEYLNLGKIPVGEDGAKHLAKLTKLTSLELEDCSLTDDALANLGGLTDLRLLNLKDNNKITNAGTRHLAGLSKLENLDLWNAKLDDAGLEELDGLTSLTHLKLGYTAVSDEGLASLAGMVRIKRLDLSGTKVKGPGLKHLAGWTALTNLDLWSLRDFTGEGLQHLVGCNNLTEINLSYTGLTDDGLAQVKRLKQLKHLDLPPYGRSYSLGEEFWVDPHPERFSDKGLAQIGEMTGLEWLWFAGSGVTDDGLANLKGLKKLKYLGFGNLPNIKGPGLENLKELPLLRGLELRDTGVTDEALEHVVGLPQIIRIELPRRATDAALDRLKDMKQLRYVVAPMGVSDKAIADFKQALPQVEVSRKYH